MALRKRKLGVQPRKLFDAYINLGDIYRSQHKWRRAMSIFAQALRVAQRQIGVISSESALALGILGEATRIRGDIQFSRQMRWWWDGENIASWRSKYYRNQYFAASRAYFERQQAIQRLLQAGKNDVSQ